MPQNPQGRFSLGHDPRRNKGGRPRGMSKLIRERYGEDGSTLVEFAHLILTGKLSVKRWMQIKDMPVEVDEGPSIKDIIWAIEFLADRGHGKPTQHVEVADTTQTIEAEVLPMEKLSREDLLQFVRVAEKALTAGDAAPGARAGQDGAGTPEPEAVHAPSLAGD